MSDRTDRAPGVEPPAPQCESSPPGASSDTQRASLAIATIGCLGFLASAAGDLPFSSRASIHTPGHRDQLEAEVGDALELLGRIIPDPEMADLRAAAHQQAQRQCVARLTDTQLGGAVRHARALVKLFQL